MAPKLSGGGRYKSRPAGWQPLPSTVAFALVVLDLDLDLLGLVAQIVGILQRLVVGLQIRRPLVGRRLLDLLVFRQQRLGRRGSGRGPCSSGGGATAASDFHEVLAIVLTAALGALDRVLVQVIEAR